MRLLEWFDVTIVDPDAATLLLVDDSQADSAPR
jgi:hypothetical protein